MPRPQQDFQTTRHKACVRTLDFLRSRPEGVALADVRAFWRILGSAGMADNVLVWLEQDECVVWDRNTGVVMLTAKGDGTE